MMIADYLPKHYGNQIIIDESNTPGSAGEIIDGWIRLDLATFSLQSSLLSSIASPVEGLTIGMPTAFPEDPYAPGITRSSSLSDPHAVMHASC